MKAILISLKDTASVNIRDRLLDIEEWEENEEFMGLSSYIKGDNIILQHPGEHIYAERIDENISDFLGERPEVIIFASRHKSESGKKALTVHVVGNYGKAEYGGRDHTLSVPAPRFMTEALRIMHRRNTLEDFAVSYEVTHHGPYLETPSFFIEIGSSEEEWRNEEAGRLIAETIIELTKSPINKDPVAIGIGGGHYAPRFTELALGYRINFGHMAPKYALEHLDDDILRQMVEKSGARYVYFHKSGLKRSEITQLSNKLEEMGVERIKSESLEKR
jgi:D-aminoacyl-tRNA deacylase